MLVLTRKENEKIRIDEKIVITVLRCGNGKVKLGLEAPREVVILRDEIEKRAA